MFLYIRGGRSCFNMASSLSSNFVAWFKQLSEEQQSRLLKEALGSKKPKEVNKLFHEISYNDSIIIRPPTRSVAQDSLQVVTQWHHLKNAAVRLHYQGLVKHMLTSDFCQLVSFFPNIHTIMIGGNELRADDAEMLARVLSQCKKLKVFSADHNWFGDDGIRHIANVLPKLLELEQLDFRKCLITEDGAKCLGANIFSSGQVTDIDLSFNSLKDSGLELLLEQSPKESHHFKKLMLDKTKITSRGMKTLSQHISLQEMEKLSLEQNDLGINGIKILSEMMKNIEVLKLKVLNLTQTNMESDGAIELSTVLPRLKNLTEFSIADNNMQDDGMQAIANNLQNNLSLQAFDIDSNGIRGKGIKCLANAMRNHKFPEFKVLSVINNPCAQYILLDLMFAMEKCPKLQHCFISSANIQFLQANQCDPKQFPVPLGFF